MRPLSVVDLYCVYYWVVDNFIINNFIARTLVVPVISFILKLLVSFSVEIILLGKLASLWLVLALVKIILMGKLASL